MNPDKDVDAFFVNKKYSKQQHITQTKNKNNSNKPSKTLVDIQHRYLHAIEAFKIR